MRSSCIHRWTWSLALLLGFFQVEVGHAQFFSLSKFKNPKPQRQAKVQMIWAHGKGADSIKTREHRFSSNGQLQSSLRFDETGDVTERYSYHFNAKENCIERFSTFRSADARVDFRSTFDSEGRELTRTRYKMDGTLMDQVVFAYNAQGRKVHEEYFNASGEKIYESRFTYDETRHIVKEFHSNVTYECDMLVVVTCNEDWQPTHFSQYKKTGPLVKSIKYIRDDAGRVLEEQIRNETGEKTKVKYSYNSWGEVQKTAYYEGSELVELNSFSYEYY